jgi:hypothetical protein
MCVPNDFNPLRLASNVCSVPACAASPADQAVAVHVGASIRTRTHHDLQQGSCRNVV